MSRKKKLFIIFLSILIPSFIIGAYLNRQLWYLNYVYARDSYSVISPELSIPGDIIKIKTVQALKYIELENIKVGNFFEDFEERDDADWLTSSSRVFVNKMKNETAVFWITKSSNEYSHISIIDLFIYTFSENEFEFNPTEFLVKYNIDNDFELIEVIINTKRNNIFTPVRQMHENAVRHFFAEMLTSYDKISMVEGDYSGRMITTSNSYVKELIIEKEGEIYNFVFMNLDYFTENRIQEIINTIIIN